MPTIEVCKTCKNRIEAIDAEGKQVCPVCMGRVFIKVEVPDEMKCDYCKAIAKWNKEKQVWILSTWKGAWGGKGEVKIGDLPFMNSERGTYYCGCRGWN